MRKNHTQPLIGENQLRRIFLNACLFLSLVLAAVPAQAVRFRLPLSSDTGVHYYYDHNTSSGITAWNCSGTSYNGHHGTDYSGGPRGRAIFAAASGTLNYKIDGFGDGYAGSPDGGGAGNHVRLDHGGGVFSWYMHMTIGSVTGKAVGSAISCSEQIGGVGTSGSSTGLHLHFDFRINGSRLDPYIGSCGGLGYWVNQGSGSPSTTCESSGVRRVSDFNGDGRTDMGIYRPSNGQWWVVNVIGGTVLGGAVGDIPVSNDYNGDGRADIGIFRPSNGQWWVENVIAGTVYGGAGDIPVPGDYNGDGRADMAIYRPSNGQWWVANVIAGTVLGGAAGDIPVPGDYNGDGRTDIGIYRPSNGQWWVENVIAGTVYGGAVGDIPVPGDYNGDGRTDIGIFRSSNGQWWVENVIAGTVYGQSGDIPVPGDYNGDGYTEMAVFRPSTGQWWAMSGINGTMFGQAGDVPTPLPAAIQNFFFGSVADIIIDNSSATMTGTWTTGSTSTDKHGADYRYKGGVAGGPNYVQFTPNIQRAGNYNVYEWHPQGSNRPIDAKHVINYNGGTTTLNVNQQINGGGWRLLGTFNFAVGTAGNIRITDGHADTTKVVMADGIKLVYVP